MKENKKHTARISIKYKDTKSNDFLRFKSFISMETVGQIIKYLDGKLSAKPYKEHK